MSIGYFEQEFDTYTSAMNYLHSLEMEIENHGYAIWAGNPERGWMRIINPIIRQRGSKWVLKMDAPQELGSHMEVR